MGYWVRVWAFFGGWFWLVWRVVAGGGRKGGLWCLWGKGCSVVGSPL